MKRTLFLSGLLILFMGSWTPNSTLAQPAERDNEAEPVKRVDDAHVGKADPADQPAGTRRFERSKPVPWASGQGLITRLGKLQEAMKDELHLSDEQLENTDKLFEDQIGRLREKATSDRSEEAETVDIEELKSLRAQMMDARKAGDVETAKKLREQMMQKARMRRLSPAGASTSQFIEKVAGQLEKEQLDAFHGLAKRFGLAERERPRPSRFRALLRALRDPELGLSEEQRRAVHNVTRESLMAHRPKEGSRVDMDEVAETARVKIIELLTPEQRPKLEALLKSAEAEGEKHGPPGTIHRKDRRARPSPPAAPPGGPKKPSGEDS